MQSNGIIRNTFILANLFLAGGYVFTTFGIVNMALIAAFILGCFFLLTYFGVYTQLITVCSPLSAVFLISFFGIDEGWIPPTLGIIGLLLIIRLIRIHFNAIQDARIHWSEMEDKQKAEEYAKRIRDTEDRHNR